jgi:hypothetical protein
MVLTQTILPLAVRDRSRPKFLVADHENNGLALILLIQQTRPRTSVRQSRHRRERSLGGVGWQISGSLGAVSTEKDGQRRYQTNELLHCRESIQESRNYEGRIKKLWPKNVVTSARFCH